MVKRWEISNGLILSEEEGGFVDYKDYQILESKITTLKKQCDKFEDTIAGLNNVLEVFKETNDSINAENAKLLKILANLDVKS